MRPPPRTTRNTKSPPSPDAAERPRPTLADIEIAPRRRLRDGSTSSRGRSSRGSSVASSSSSRASSVRRAVVSAAIGTATTTLSRGRATTVPSRQRHVSISSSASSSSFSSNRTRIWRGQTPYPDDEERRDALPSSSESSGLSPPPEELPVPSIRAAPGAILPSVSPSARRSESIGIEDVLEDLVGLEHLPPPSTPPSVPSDRTRRRQLHAYPTDRPQSPLGTASSASSSSGPIAIDAGAPGRRYTAQEKGKGRAVIGPIEVDESSPEGDDSIQVINVSQKRKRSRSGQVVEAASAEHTAVNEIDMDEDSLLGTGYMCPICFCAPTQAVMTPCGHILCARCLHSSLIAAIGRNPNPHPNQQPLYPRGGRGGRGRGGSGRFARGRGGTAAVAARNGRVLPYGPAEWTVELLQEAWVGFQASQAKKTFERSEMPKEEWDVALQSMLPETAQIKVEEVLKGLWKIDGHAWVVEGECPVCRNVLPGGFGPPYSGIGGITPIKARLSRAVTKTNKRRK
ncbi:hypothetical protein IAR55_002048 [Kwoniella newhampshirensis]|uniref:RING-type domain-containing protein n=1 Tax=Kwoniella newhampshirensis TaxID=1651941 RepID=A0AAW0Z0K1_9TREE